MNNTGPFNMPTIKTTVDAATYSKLVAMRKKRGVPSVSALFLDLCGFLNDQKEAAEIVKRAFSLAAKRSGQPKYKLRDLFPKQHWEQFSKPARILAGKMFNAKVEAAKMDASDVRIKIEPKSTSNHSYYRTL